jgi:type I restriction enzyme, R subunit
MIEGVPVDVRRADGSIGGELVRLIDFDDPDANDWLAVNQYTVIESKANRRPDVVIFVNGLPLVAGHGPLRVLRPRWGDGLTE